MTTNFRIVSARDLSIPNKVYLLPKVNGCTLAGAAYLSSSTSKHVATAEGISFFYNRVADKLNTFAHVAFIGHASPQEDNRITRFRGVIGYMKHHSIPVPTGLLHSETRVLNKNGVRYFVAIDLDIVSPDIVANVLRSSALSSFLLAIDRSIAVEVIAQITSSGWTSRPAALPPEVIELICTKPALAYFPLGWFDDPEPGCALAAKAELIQSAMS